MKTRRTFLKLLATLPFVAKKIPDVVSSGPAIKAAIENNVNPAWVTANYSGDWWFVSISNEAECLSHWTKIDWSKATYPENMGGDNTCG